MGTSTPTVPRPSTPARYLGARDPGNQAALALLRRAGEQARLLRLRRSPFKEESAADAARSREIVAKGLHAGHYPGAPGSGPPGRPGAPPAR